MSLQEVCCVCLGIVVGVMLEAWLHRRRLS